MRTSILRNVLVAGAVLFCNGLPAQQSKKETPALPKLPTGYDAYLRWDQWPMQRIGARTYMRSTYDRTGGNEGADASHFLFMKGEDYNVSLDVTGRGILYFVRTNHWHGSPWHYVVDGKDNILQETGTSDPVNAKKKFTDPQFIPSTQFSEPLNWTWGTTKGADLVWTPIPFRDSVRLAYSRTRYGTGYYIYQLYANEEQLSQPIQSWDLNKAPSQDVHNLLAKAGTDIAPMNIRKKTGRLKLNKENVLVANISAASSQIRALKFTLPLDKAIENDKVKLRITWDGSSSASVDAPLSLFFGTGTFYNREKKEFLVKGFPISVRFDYSKNTVDLACYYPMPFFSSAKVELTGVTPGDTEMNYEIRYEPMQTAAHHASYFHATYKDMPEPELGKDLVLLDTRGVEGQQDWSGNFVGTSFIFSQSGNLGTLEGDPRFFFDDSQTPQAYGTGTEEWGGGGDYWGGQNMTLPFAGHPVGCRRKEDAKDEHDLIESGYRFLLADLMPFGNRARIHLEHGGENMSSEHYETVTYWYGIPAPSLVKTDELDIGSEASEKAHGYSSPDASPVQSLTSRYEWGIDNFPVRVWGMDTSKIKGYSDLKGKEVYPAVKEDGRFTRGTSEFAAKVDPSNKGIVLRRTLDYSFPNQKAEVYIADGNGDQANWQLAGIWYLAGSNTCVYSNPPGELDERVYNVQTSNRRLRDDEFLVPARLTQNQASVRIRVKAIKNDTELYPDYRFPRENAWSELKYSVYSFVIPDFRGKLK
jgi:hypothetical protein